jgi:hypothetical protein
MNNATAHCPHCDPLHPELDEDGFPYTCYVCCDTGIVSKAYADAYWQEQEDNAQYRGMRPVVNGKHIVQKCDEYESWEEERPLLPASIFTKAKRIDTRTPHEIVMDDFDDIPY